jgi:hypothetical protein
VLSLPACDEMYLNGDPSLNILTLGGLWGD